MNLLKINTTDYAEIIINLDHVLMIRPIMERDEWRWIEITFVNDKTRRFDFELYVDAFQNLPCTTISYDQRTWEDRCKARAEAEAEHKAKRDTNGQTNLSAGQ